MTQKILLLAAILLLSHLTNAQTYVGKIISVKDGDSYQLLTENHEIIEIRLAHVDTPELNQLFGTPAKIVAAEMMWGKIVTATQTTKDRYGRIVAIVEVEGKILNLELVKQGFAWHFKKYSSDETYAAAENRAKSQKVGLWSQSNPVAPWNYRKRK